MSEGKMALMRSNFGYIWRTDRSMEIGRPMRHGIYLSVIVLLVLSESVRAQAPSSPLGGGTSVGAAGGLTLPARGPLLSAENGGARRHMGLTGKPCLAVSGDARQERLNPNLFEHMIVAKNDCGRLIKLQVCYYQSQNCVAMNVPPYGREELVLGIMPEMSGFRFEFREKFDQF